MLTSHKKRIMEKTAAVALKVTAVISSVIVALTIIFLIALMNIDYFAPVMLRSLNKNPDLNVDFSHIEVDWEDLKPLVDISDLDVQLNKPGAQLQVAVDSLKVKPSFGLLYKGVVGVEYIVISKPRISGEVDLEYESEISDEKSGIDQSELTQDLLDNIQLVKYVVVEDGVINIVWNSASATLNSVATVDVETWPTENGYRMLGKIESSMHHDSILQIHLELDEATELNNVPRLNMNLDAKSVDLAWFDIAGLPRVQFSNASTVFNSNIKAQILANAFEFVEWELSAVDTKLKGKIANANHSYLASQGKWTKAEGAGFSGQLEASIEIQALDVVELMRTFPTSFPPKFRKHMETRLYSLEIPKIKATYFGNPTEYMKNPDSSKVSVDGEFKNMKFVYGTNLPPIEDGNGTFRLRGKRFEAESTSGNIYGEPVSYTTYIEDVTVKKPDMYVSGEMSIPLPKVFELFGPNGTAFPGRSKSIISGSGIGNIKMSIHIPVREGRNFSFDGEATPVDSVQITTNEGVEITSIDGRVEFDRVGITSGEVSGNAFGGELSAQFSGQGAKGSREYTGQASGVADIEQLNTVLGGHFSGQLNGSTDWKASYKVSGEGTVLQISSSLQGVEIDLPKPFLKPASEDWPLTLDVHTRNGTERETAIDFGEKLKGSIFAELGDGKWVVMSGAFGLGDEMPEFDKSRKGLAVNASLEQFEYDAWNRALASTKNRPQGLSVENLYHLNVSVGKLVLANNKEFLDTTISLRKTDNHIAINVDSDKLKGAANYRSAEFIGEGETPRLQMVLSKCHWPVADNGEAESSTGEAVNPRSVPELDFSCEDTQYGELRLGKARVLGKPHIDGWEIVEADFTSPAMTVEASGNWVGNPQFSQIDFEITSSNFEGAMEAVGYEDMIGGGSINISGELYWNDALTEWSGAKSSGNIAVHAEQGRILSLQNAALDLISFFNYDTFTRGLGSSAGNVLEAGYEFSAIAGSGTLKNGEINIDRLTMNGPSAEISIGGTTSWATKTHNLKVRVKPQLRKALTTITTLVNPTTGILTYLGQKIFGQLNPVEVSIPYTITGSWKKPIVKSATQQ